MDKLDTIFDMQKSLDEYIVNKRNLQNIKPEEWVQKQTLAMISELSELLNEVNYKWWKNEKELDLPAIKEELVDVLHFFVGMCNQMNMSAQEMFDIYLSKNKENYDRQQGLSSQKDYK